MATLETLEAQLAEILKQIAAIKDAPPPAAAPKFAYETPVLDVSQVVPDGKTVNRDGSVWAVDDGRWSGKKGAPVMVSYGYHSEAKDPALWAKIKATLGPEAFARWEKRRDPWALYKVDLREYLSSGAENMITLSYFLNSYGRLVQ
ncbi:MAG: hypothetical protein QG602_3450 [Verrucomicrobiota bacterium]|nr:hypothetical protein [Verrucomicrobiota bacterium]